MSGTVAFIQARTSSSRFPGKVLADLGGMPMIVFMVQRVRRARTVDQVVVVTSTDASDDPLARTLAEHGVPCFRGDLNDVLLRYAAAAESVDAQEILRLTGDCPLIDADIIDTVVQARRLAGADYASNIDPPTFPDGTDVEVFTRATLVRAAREARQPAEREHVTLWMRTEGARLNRVNVPALADMSGLRLTVDYPDDLAAVREVVAQLAQRAGGQSDLYDVLRCLARRRDIVAMNKHARNEGLAASLAAQQSRSDS
jgi:spore coat polysaccharide biosynthesis protein SpsF (cytidylyltransferase family)